jgi:hypothetical protein
VAASSPMTLKPPVSVRNVGDHPTSRARKAADVNARVTRAPPALSREMGGAHALSFPVDVLARCGAARSIGRYAFRRASLYFAPCFARLSRTATR